MANIAVRTEEAETEKRMEEEMMPEFYRGKHLHLVERNGKMVPDWHEISERHDDALSQRADEKCYQHHEDRGRRLMFSFSRGSCWDENGRLKG